MSENTKKIEKKDPKGILDKLVGKAVSRKLLVWVTATFGLFLGVTPADQWVAVALIYIGSQGVVDLATAWKKAG